MNPELIKRFSLDEMRKANRDSQLLASKGFFSAMYLIPLLVLGANEMSKADSSSASQVKQSLTPKIKPKKVKLTRSEFLRKKLASPRPKTDAPKVEPQNVPNNVMPANFIKPPKRLPSQIQFLTHREPITQKHVELLALLDQVYNGRKLAEGELNRVEFLIQSDHRLSPQVKRTLIDQVDTAMISGNSANNMNNVPANRAYLAELEQYLLKVRGAVNHDQRLTHKQNQAHDHKPQDKPGFKPGQGR